MPVPADHPSLVAIELTALSLYDIHPDTPIEGADLVAARIVDLALADLQITCAYAIGLLVATIRALAHERRTTPDAVLKTVAITVQAHGAPQ